MSDKTLEGFMEARVKEVDNLHLDPSQRATYVNSLIFHALGLEGAKDAVEQPLYWDLICYCMEMLNIYVVQTCMDTEDRDTIVTLKKLNSFIYSIHYSLPEDSPMLGPDKLAHTQLWEERLISLVGEDDGESEGGQETGSAEIDEDREASE
jgi:hypothetical protein